LVLTAQAEEVIDKGVPADVHWPVAAAAVAGTRDVSHRDRAYPMRYVMPGLLIGYARVSTEEQDLTAQRDGLQRLGVEPSRIYVDHGLTGTNRDRPGLREALAACRAGDTLVVTKLDRLARSLPDARAIAEDLTRRTVRLRPRWVGIRPGRPGRPAAVQRPCHGGRI
jgi:hypothetical protein